MAHITKALVFRIKRFLNKLGGGGNKLHGIRLSRRFHNVDIIGTNNIIDVRSKLPKDVRIFIYGNNHHLIVEENVTFKRGHIWFEDHDCEISIGTGTTIEEAELSVAENGTKITIGKDCMFSRGVHITTTDSHSIISIETGQRTNPAKNIEIRDHVWLGYNVNINKGVTIEENSVVAGHSVVTKSIPGNSIAAGVPAKIVKTGITWDRSRI